MTVASDDASASSSYPTRGGGTDLRPVAVSSASSLDSITHSNVDCSHLTATGTGVGGTCNTEASTPTPAAMDTDSSSSNNNDNNILQTSTDSNTAAFGQATSEAASNNTPTANTLHPALSIVNTVPACTTSSEQLRPTQTAQQTTTSTAPMTADPLAGAGTTTASPMSTDTSPLAAAAAAAAAASSGASVSAVNGTAGILPRLQPVLPAMMLPPPHMAVVAAAGDALSTAANNSIPEFLYQLTKMLTDDNREIIEWSKGMIEVHSPHRLEKEVLQKYFRHSKFASFQRQLNYFGFRKLAGKGKMAPCSYANEAATGDLSSILYIKRKTTPGTASKEKTGKKKDQNLKLPPAKRPSGQTISTGHDEGQHPPVNPVLANILQRAATTTTQTSAATASSSSTSNTPTTTTSSSTVTTTTSSAIVAPVPAPTIGDSSTTNKKPTGSQHAIAQAAVGRGIRHSFALPVKRPSPTITSALGVPSPLPIPSLPLPPSLTQSSSSAATSLTTPSTFQQQQQPLTAVPEASGALSSTTLHATTGSDSTVVNDPTKETTTTKITTADDNLSQLVNNYRNSLHDLASTSSSQQQEDTRKTANTSMESIEQLESAMAAAVAAAPAGCDPTPLSQMQQQAHGLYVPGLLSRNSSLIDLAMIPSVDDDVGLLSDVAGSLFVPEATQQQQQQERVQQQQQQLQLQLSQPSITSSSTPGFLFVDFPHPELHPAARENKSKDDEDDVEGNEF